jgi:DeoR/GlpR family transcriptional regulator of sugar metabolism
MVRSAKTIIVTADHGKLGRDTLSTIIPITEAHCLITGKEGDEEIIERLKRYIEVILV